MPAALACPRLWPRRAGRRFVSTARALGSGPPPTQGPARLEAVPSSDRDAAPAGRGARALTGAPGAAWLPALPSRLSPPRASGSGPPPRSALRPRESASRPAWQRRRRRSLAPAKQQCSASLPLPRPSETRGRAPLAPRAQCTGSQLVTRGRPRHCSLIAAPVTVGRGQCTSPGEVTRRGPAERQGPPGTQPPPTHHSTADTQTPSR